MYAKHPRIAELWSKKDKTLKNLPEKKKKSKKKASGPFKKKDTLHRQAVIVDKGVAAGKPVTRVDEDDETPAYYSDERGTSEDAQIWSREEAEAARKERKKKSKKEAVWTVKNSQLHGLGLFSNQAVAPGQTIVKAAKRMGGQDGLDRYEITFATRYANHSGTPNARLKKVASGRVEIIAEQPIKAGAEVLVDYHRTQSALGPGSYMTYRGKVRATRDQLEKQAAGYLKFAQPAPQPQPQQPQQPQQPGQEQQQPGQEQPQPGFVPGSIAAQAAVTPEQQAHVSPEAVTAAQQQGQQPAQPEQPGAPVQPQQPPQAIQQAKQGASLFLARIKRATGPELAPSPPINEAKNQMNVVAPQPDPIMAQKSMKPPVPQLGGQMPIATPSSTSLGVNSMSGGAPPMPKLAAEHNQWLAKNAVNTSTALLAGGALLGTAAGIPYGIAKWKESRKEDAKMEKAVERNLRERRARRVAGERWEDEKKKEEEEEKEKQASTLEFADEEELAASWVRLHLAKAAHGPTDSHSTTYDRVKTSWDDHEKTAARKTPAPWWVPAPGKKKKKKKDPTTKQRRKGAPRTTTRTKIKRDGKKGESTITTRSRPGKKVEKSYK